MLVISALRKWQPEHCGFKASQHGQHSKTLSVKKKNQNYDIIPKSQKSFFLVCLVWFELGSVGMGSFGFETLHGTLSIALFF